MARGRRPKSIDEKRRTGNPGKRKLVEEVPATGKPRPEAAAISNALRPPKTLTNPQAIEVFNDLLKTNINLGQRLWRDSDMAALGRYCDAFVRWHRATVQLDELDGDTYETDSAHGKMIRTHPLVGVRSRYHKELQDFEDRFGLNPAARQTILQKTAAIGAQGSLPLNPDHPPQKTKADDQVVESPVTDEPKSVIGVLSASRTRH